MGKYADSQYNHLAGMSALMEATDNPHHRAILQNYQRHNALEQAGRWEEVLTPDMTVEHPVYRVKFGDELTVLDGKEAVGGWYASMGGHVQSLVDEKLAVNDWGIASHSTHVVFTRGADLMGQGVEVDDPEAIYLVETPLAMFWFYTEDARLIGEHLYQLEASTIRKADPDDVLTHERMIESCEAFLQAA